MGGLGWVPVPGLGRLDDELRAIRLVRLLRENYPSQAFRYEERRDDRGRKVFVILQLR